MVNNIAISEKHRERACIKSRKRRRRNTPFLPVEIIFDILLRLPADILFHTMRYVCKQWYNIINDPLFIKKQLLLVRSVISVCFQCDYRTISFAQFGKRKGKLLSELFVLPFSAKLLSTCDGLMLFRHKTFGGGYNIHVANPLTKQLLTLPPIQHYMPLSSATFSIGRSSFAVEYKVVFTCHTCGSVYYGVFTLGKDDNWRITASEWLYRRDRMDKILLIIQPIITGKFLHWSFSDDTCNLFTMDVESEKFSVFSSPKSDNGFLTSDYVARGDSMTCMKTCFNTMMWEVWVSLDDTCREWKKLCVIDFRPRKYRLRRMVQDLFRDCYFQTDIRPIAWIENGDVLIFKTCCLPDPFIVYNIKTGYAYHLRCHENHVCRGFCSSYAPSLLSLN